MFFLLLIDQIDVDFVHNPESADEAHVLLKPSSLSYVLCPGTQTCFGVYCTSCLSVHARLKFSLLCSMCCGKQSVVILSLTNLLLIRPIIALFTLCLSLVQVGT